MEGRLGELRVLILEMVEKEQGRNNPPIVPKSSRKHKGSRKLLNLVLSINNDKKGGGKRKGVKLLGI